MADHVVAKIDAPWERCFHAVGSIGESGQEAANAANRHADSKRDSEQIPGRCAHAEDELGGFDADEAADERTNNRLALEKEDRIVEVLPGADRIFEPVQHLAAD